MVASFDVDSHLYSTSAYTFSFHIDTYVHVCMCIYMYVCVCACTHALVCVCTWVHKY